MSTIRYSDIDLDFKPNPVTGDVIVLTNEAAVKRSVRNLVLTSFYERPFHPEIGSNMSRLLFEPMTNATALEIRASVLNVIANYEPRVTVLGIDVRMQPDSNEYYISINFQVMGYVDPTTINLFVERVR